MDFYYADQVSTGSLSATVASLESSTAATTLTGQKVTGGWRFTLPGGFAEGVYSVRYVGSEIDAYSILDTNPVQTGGGTVDLTEIIALLKADEVRDGNLYQKRAAGTATVLVQKTRTVTGDRVTLVQS